MRSKECPGARRGAVPSPRPRDAGRGRCRPWRRFTVGREGQRHHAVHPAVALRYGEAFQVSRARDRWQRPAGGPRHRTFLPTASVLPSGASATERNHPSISDSLSPGITSGGLARVRRAPRGDAPLRGIRPRRRTPHRERRRRPRCMRAVERRAFAMPVRLVRGRTADGLLDFLDPIVDDDHVNDRRLPGRDRPDQVSLADDGRLPRSRTTSRRPSQESRGPSDSLPC